MPDSPLDRDLEEMAGTRGLAASLKQSLERLKTGVAGKDLAEMATEVLEGRTDLRDVARSSAYASQIGEGITAFRGWEDGLVTEERERFEREQQRIASDDFDVDT